MQNEVPYHPCFGCHNVGTPLGALCHECDVALGAKELRSAIDDEVLKMVAKKRPTYIEGWIITRGWGSKHVTNVEFRDIDHLIELIG